MISSQIYLRYRSYKLIVMGLNTHTFTIFWLNRKLSVSAGLPLVSLEVAFVS